MIYILTFKSIIIFIHVYKINKYCIKLIIIDSMKVTVILHEHIIIFVCFSNILLFTNKLINSLCIIHKNTIN